MGEKKKKKAERRRDSGDGGEDFGFSACDGALQSLLSNLLPFSPRARMFPPGRCQPLVAERSRHANLADSTSAAATNNSS